MAWKGKSRMSHTPWYTNMASGKCIKLFSFSYNQEGIHLHIHTYFCLVTFRCLVWRTGGFFRRQYKFTISKTQWKMNMKLREKRNEVMSDDAQNIYIYIYYILLYIYNYTIVQYIYGLCHYMMFVYLRSVRFWKISCGIQDLRSSICRSWTNTSAHPLRYPRPVMKRRLVYPAFHPISTLRSCVLPESEVSTTSGVNGIP